MKVWLDINKVPASFIENPHTHYAAIKGRAGFVRELTYHDGELTAELEDVQEFRNGLVMVIDPDAVLKIEEA